MTHSEKLENIVDDAVIDLGEIFANTALVNKRSEVERIVRRVASDTIGVTREIVDSSIDAWKRS